MKQYEFRYQGRRFRVTTYAGRSTIVLQEWIVPQVRKPYWRKVAKTGRSRWLHKAIMSGRSMSFFAVNSGKEIRAAVLPNYVKSDPR